MVSTNVKQYIWPDVYIQPPIGHAQNEKMSTNPWQNDSQVKKKNFKKN